MIHESRHNGNYLTAPSSTSHHVVVVGSANLDLVAPVPHHPKGGETLLGGDLTRHPGGKGANQAVASARAGAVHTAFVGAVGNDDAAHVLLQSLQSAGVDTTHVRQVDYATGTALISVDVQGENAIIVTPGANSKVAIASTEKELIASAAVVLSQLEIPVETVIDAARSRAPGSIFMLNAAPSRSLPDELWEQIDVLIVNEHEAADLAHSTEDPRELAQILLARVPAVIITLGAEGCLIAERHENEEATLPQEWAQITHQKAFRVESVDTTGAGDTFCGALAAAVASSPDLSLTEATRIATAAGALATTRYGAQTGVPTYDEVYSLTATTE